MKNQLRLPTPEELQQALDSTVDWIMQTDPQHLAKYVEKLRSQNSGLSNDELAERILRRRSFKNGLVGAATGIPGLLALPVTVPIDLAASWKIQVFGAMAIAYVYGHTHETADLKTDVYLILAGDSAKEALKRFGIETSKSITKKAVDKYITREVMQQIWKVVGRHIITKAGEKSLTSFMKLVPVIGAPIGFGFDYVAARIVLRNAINYYSGQS